MRTGAVHLPYPVKRASYDSPFDYPRASRVIVVNDVNREDMDQVAAAYRELFLAAGGGALGLFTAISRLRAVHKRLAAARWPRRACRFTRSMSTRWTPARWSTCSAPSAMPACWAPTRCATAWTCRATRSASSCSTACPGATPTILERARKEAFGGNAYTDMVVRLRLRQAFGRLIRRAGDRGSFVMLDSAPRLALRHRLSARRRDRAHGAGGGDRQGSGGGAAGQGTAHRLVVPAETENGHARHHQH